MELAHISALETKHAGLERRIAEELARPSPNGVLVMELKRRKLRLKEELAQLQLVHCASRHAFLQQGQPHAFGWPCCNCRATSLPAGYKPSGCQKRLPQDQQSQRIRIYEPARRCGLQTARSALGQCS